MRTTIIPTAYSLKIGSRNRRACLVTCSGSRISKRGTTAHCRFLCDELQGHQICKMEPPAMMDGGDILRLGDLFFVGRSTRTNDAGIQELKDLLDHLGHELRVVDIPSHALHLTSVSSTPSDQIILAPEGYLTPEAFGEMPEGCEVIMMPEEEVYGCNTIGLPDNKVLIADGYPTVKKTLEDRGFQCIVIDMGEIRAADGSLTCWFDIRALGGEVAAGVAKLGQRRWDEVPVSMSSQVQILPSALIIRMQRASQSNQKQV